MTFKARSDASSKGSAESLRAIVRNSSQMLLSSLVAQGMTLIAVVIFMRHGSPSNFGKVAGALGAAAIVSDLLDLGTGTYLLRAVTSHELSIEAAKRLLTTRNRAITVALMVGAVPAFSLGGTTAVASEFYLGAYLFAQGRSSLKRSQGNFRAVSLGAILERGVALVAFLAASVLSQMSPSMFIASMAIGALAQASFLKQKAECVRWTDGQMTLRQLYVKSISLGLSGMATDLNSLETPLVYNALGADAAGRYGAAWRIALPMYTPVSAISTVLSTEFAKRRGDNVQAANLLRRTTILVLPVGLILVIAAVFAPWIVRYSVGEAYSTETPSALRIFCLFLLLGTANQLLFVHSQAMDQERRTARALWATIPLGLLLTWALGRTFGLVPAAFGGLIAQATLTIWLAFIFMKSRHVVYRSSEGQS